MRAGKIFNLVLIFMILISMFGVPENVNANAIPETDQGCTPQNAFEGARFIAVDRNDNLYVYIGEGPTAGTIKKMDAQTGEITIFKTGYKKAGAFTVDPSGNIYLAHTDDAGKYLIKKIDQNGHESVLVELANGTYELTIAADNMGNLYYRHTINSTQFFFKKINSNGEVSDFGSFSKEELRQMKMLTNDVFGNVYILSDVGGTNFPQINLGIKKVTSTHEVLTYANVAAPFVAFGNMFAVDTDGTIYIPNSDSGYITVNNNSNMTIKFAELFSQAMGPIAVDSHKNFYIIEGFGNRAIVKKVTEEGSTDLENSEIVVESIGASKPVIRTPIQNQEVVEGSRVAFNVAAESGCRYEWFKGDQIIESATSSSYVIENALLEDEGKYTVRIHNSVGYIESSATLDVYNKANTPTVINTMTEEDTLSMSGLNITKNPADGSEITHFKITGITGGTLYFDDGATQINNGDFIAKSEADKGLKFKPNSNANTPASDTFAFKVQASLDAKGKGLSNTTEASIMVNEVNDSPVATDDSLADISVGSGDNAIDFEKMTANDSKGPSNESNQSLTITAVNEPVGGTVRLEGNCVIFTPSANFVGAASFNYTVQDNGTTNGAADLKTAEGIARFNILPNSTINPSTGTFDKYTFSNENAEVTTFMTLNGNELISIQYNGTPLVKNNDYAVDGNMLIIQKGYLENQPLGITTLTLEFSAGKPQNLVINVKDSTPKNSTIAPTTGNFDKAFLNQADVLTTMTLNGNTLRSISNNGSKLTLDTDYSVNGDKVTIKKEYLAKLPIGMTNITFNFSEGNTQTLTIIVVHTVIPVDGVGLVPSTLTFTEGDAPQTLTATVFPDLATNKDVIWTSSDTSIATVSNTGVVTPVRAGTAIITVTTIDGQYTAISSVTIQSRDTEAPVGTISYSSTKPTNQDVTASILFNEDNVTIINNVGSDQYVFSENGTFIFEFMDQAGNHGTKIATVTNIDKIPPVVNGVENEQVYQSNVTITFNEGTATLNGKEFANDKVVSNDGTYSLVVTDLAGNTTSVQFKIQKPYTGGSQPSEETIELTVDVESGSQGTTISKTPIKRTKQANGKVIDQVVFTEISAQETITQLTDRRDSTARIIIPDEKDEVSEVNISIPKNTLSTLKNADANLGIDTANAKIMIPYRTLLMFDQDLYFRVVPIKDEDKKDQVKERAQKEQMVKEIAKGQEIKILGRPAEIETNMQSQPVTIVLPLKVEDLSKDEVTKKKQLNKTVVFIEHSDGTKELVRGKVVSYKVDTIGIEFSIKKFSTFTMVYMEGADEYFAELEKGQAHQAYLKGYPNGSFKPNHSISRGEMAAILARNLSEPNKRALSFKDLKKSHWAFEEIQVTVGSELMTGYPGNGFKADGAITRAEMAAIVYRWLKLESESQVAFADSKKHWGAAFISAVEKAGFMVGYPDGTFKPDQLLTRAEAVTVMNKVLERGPLEGVSKQKWPDVPSSHWAYKDITEASHTHLFRIENDVEQFVE